MKHITLLLLLISSFFISTAQQLSNTAEVSVITVEAGEALNDTWGHSAIRIKDRKLGFDIVYNYGTYDFNTPNFYTKFMQGKLLFDLGVNKFPDFLRHYKRQNRGVIEQVLDLTQAQKQAYFDYLQNNAKPENSKYLYEFFFDNCATKIRVVNTEILNKEVTYHDELFNDDVTFRDLIYQKLDNHPWGKFGIDIALGSVIDRKATPKEFTFLPSYIFENFKHAQIKKDGKVLPLVKQTNFLYKQRETVIKNSIITPLLMFSLLALLVLFLTYRDFKYKIQNRHLDFIILLVTGLVGLLVVLLWFATDHSATKNNYNIFWAFLPNLYFAFYVYKTKKETFLKKYYLLLLVLIFIQILLWLFKVEVFNLAMIPILLMLSVRYFYNNRSLT
ncbi:MAG TPA: DUF4105 domain-containing protein [Flavobacteriaceae bacterium]|nr:DUF4105 domain-containing protein [Flavobacteriaceae bacterium]